MANRIIFLRHAETDWNLQGRLTSHTDIGLNDNGRAQAQGIAGQILSAGVTRVVSSPLKRAQETAREVSTVGMPISCDERLREFNFGPFEGLTRAEMRERGIESDFMGWMMDDSFPTPAGAEDYPSAEKRAREAFDDVISMPDETVMLVSHGHFIRIMISVCVLGAKGHFHRRLRLDNAHLAEVLIDHGMPRLVAFNTKVLS